MSATTGVRRQRIVLLGASNLTMGLPIVIGHLQRNLPGPTDFYVAHGLGRSLGMTSRVLIRELPAILSCGIWQALANSPARPTRVLFTDIGNDILYQVPAGQIGSWVGEIFSRIAELDPRGVVTALPVAGVSALSEARFRFFRSLLYPPSRISRAEALAAVMAVNDHVAREASRLGLTLLTPDSAWYGPDQIHIGWRARPLAWRAMAALLLEQPDDKTLVFPRQTSAALGWRCRAERERWCGKERSRRQPCWRGADGSAMYCY